MNVHALLPYPYGTSGSQRYRIEQWQPLLADAGIGLTLSHLLHEHETVRGLWARPPRPRALAQLFAGTSRRAMRIIGESPPDVWLLHREATMIGPPLLEWIAARRAPVVMDLDDAIWLPAADGRLSLANVARMTWKANSTMRLCAGVSAGNEYIAAHARRFTPEVEVVPSSIAVNGMYSRLKEHAPSAELVVGWTGSHSTAQYLESLLPMLARLSAALPLRLLVIGAEVRHAGIRIECRPWRAATEVDDLLEMDVGLMPLPDDPWTRGKCGLKALQYMALGIPAIVSPVGVNATIVTHGANGLHARNDEEWACALSGCANAQMRSHLGAAARQTVVTRYSDSVAAGALARLLRRVVAVRAEAA